MRASPGAALIARQRHRSALLPLQVPDLQIRTPFSEISYNATGPLLDAPLRQPARSAGKLPAADLDSFHRRNGSGTSFARATYGDVARWRLK